MYVSLLLVNGGLDISKETIDLGHKSKYRGINQVKLIFYGVSFLKFYLELLQVCAHIFLSFIVVETFRLNIYRVLNIIDFEFALEIYLKFFEMRSDYYEFFEFC